jgi:hypothetical protein
MYLIAGEGLQNLGLCLAPRAIQQGGIFIVPRLLWHRASVHPGPPRPCNTARNLISHKKAFSTYQSFTRGVTQRSMKVSLWARPLVEIVHIPLLWSLPAVDLQLSISLSQKLLLRAAGLQLLNYKNLIKLSLLKDKINLHTFYKWYITLYVVITLVRYPNAKFSFCNLN